MKKKTTNIGIYERFVDIHFVVFQILGVFEIFSISI